MKVKFERIYKDYSIGDITEIDDKEELDYLTSTKTIIILEEDFASSEISETEEIESSTEKVNKKGKIKK